MITSELNKRAWTIRKEAAEKFNCPVMEIAWGVCLEMAKSDQPAKQERKVSKMNKSEARKLGRTEASFLEAWKKGDEAFGEWKKSHNFTTETPEDILALIEVLGAA